MPEGPEIHLSCLFVNSVCSGRMFTGEVTKSAVSKNPDILFSSPRYTITAEARGKELALFLTCLQKNPDENGSRVRLLFRFGMTGRFRFTSAADMPKHSHLQFYTMEEPQNILNFVDSRRFGSWRVSECWGEERGPDPMTEHEEFKKNILEHLEDAAFNRPICELLLNQKYFNGIGNYLRAEILFRAGIPPFTRAHDVLSAVTDQSEEEKRKATGKSKKACFSAVDFLQLFHDVPLEVINLKVGLGKSVDCSVTEEDYQRFLEWLRCYENPAMSNLVDHNGRTIWFKGEAGPLAPKVKKFRGRNRRKQAPISSPFAVKQETTDGDEAIGTEQLTLLPDGDSATGRSRRKRTKQSSSTAKKKATEHQFSAATSDVADSASGARGCPRVSPRRSQRLKARAGRL